MSCPTSLVKSSHRRRRIYLQDLGAVRAVVEAVNIPVLSNGNVRFARDIENNLAYTGAAGIMAAEGLLANPALFALFNRCVRVSVCATSQSAREASEDGNYEDSGFGSYNRQLRIYSSIHELTVHLEMLILQT